MTAALDALAELYCAGQDVTITDVEQAISDYAVEHPTSIKIASKSGYQEVYLTGPWPETITLNALVGDSTVIIIVSENGVQTTINADGTITTGTYTGSDTDNGSNSEGNSGGGSETSGTNTGGGSETTSVAAPTINGNTSFAESTEVTMSAESGAEIRYTTDGSTPTAESSLYSTALSVSDTTTVKAIAIKDGVSSSVASKTFTKSSGGDDSE